jgi:hypothetical protein
MATVHVSRRWLAQMPIGSAVEEPARDPPAYHALVQDLGRLAEALLGVLVFLTGAAMLFTLWLIPLGLPLCLLGLAVMHDSGWRQTSQGK